MMNNKGHTDNRVLLTKAHLGSSHVANFKLAMGSIDEDVVTLDVTMDDGR